MTEHRGIFTSLCPRPIYTLQHRTLFGAAEAHDARKHPPGFWALRGTVRELQSPIPTNSLMPPPGFQARVTELGSVVVCVRVY